MADSSKRILGRQLAKELKPHEIDQVSGGGGFGGPTTQYTEITGDRREPDTIND